jgi:hypothetical protein
MLACLIDGVKFFTMKSMSSIGLTTYLKAAAIGIGLVWLYDRIQFNLFTSHVGVIYRKLAKHYGVDVRTLMSARQ